jgi:hypothetical protein
MLLSNFTKLLRKAKFNEENLNRMKLPVCGVGLDKLGGELEKCGRTPRSECGHGCDMSKFVVEVLKNGEDTLENDFKAQEQSSKVLWC